MLALSNPNVLTEIDLFKDISSDELAWLAQNLHRRTFPARSNIFLAEQPGEVIYIILNGTIKVFIDQSCGTELILAILRSGDTVLGELSLLEETVRSANAVAMEESTLLWMDRATFWQCLQRIPTITYRLVKIICGRLRLANEQIRALTGLDTHSRVAHQLLVLAQEHGQTTPSGDTLIPIRLTQSDLANLIGASRERVNRIMMAYRQKGYLSVARNYHITLHNLEALSQRCY